MADNSFEVRGLDELIAKMRHFPRKLQEMKKLGLTASLLALWENVPSYPAPPTDSTYRRTGTLGRTLGSSEAGGKSGGQPDIYKVSKLGSTNSEARFGTRLSYAPYVIGDQQARQNAHWWKLDSILSLAGDKLTKIWEGIAKQMAKFLDTPSSGVK